MTPLDQFVGQSLTRLINQGTNIDTLGLSKSEAERALKLLQELAQNPEMLLTMEMADLRAKARRAMWPFYQRILNLGRALNSMEKDTPGMKMWMDCQGYSQEDCELAMRLADEA